MRKIPKWLRWLGYAFLGPITGPLVAGIVRHRKKDPILAVMYGVAALLTWCLLSWIFKELMSYDVSHFS